MPDPLRDFPELKRYTPYSIIDKAVYKEEILEVRKQGIAYDREEYIEGMVAFAIPIKANSRDLQAAIWAVGMTRQVPNSSIQELPVAIFLLTEALWICYIKSTHVKI